MSEGASVEGGFWSDAADADAVRRFRTLLNAVDDGIYQLDADGQFVAVNDVIVDRTGYDREELLGSHVSAILPDADVARAERELRRQLDDETDATEPIELAVATAAGETIHCELRMSPLVEDGQFRGSVGVVRDVDDRVRAERTVDEQRREIRRERDLVERILETSPVGVVVVAADGEVTRMNDRAEELLGVEADELEGYVDEGRRVFETDGQSLSADEQPVATALETGEPVYDRHLRVERPDGESRWLSVSAAPVFDADGEIDRVVTAGEDITDLKERERRLERETEELSTELEEIFGRISDGFLALDGEYRFTHVNERAAEILDADADGLLGETVWEAFPELVDSPFEAGYREAMATQEPVSVEGYYPPLDCWYEERVYPSESGLSVYFRDVTERKRRERELQRTERRFEAVFEDPNILVGLLEPDGTVIDINETAMEYVDASLPEVTGEPFWETPWWGEGDDTRAEVREWTERAAAGEYVDFEIDLTRPDGEAFTISGYFRPVTDDEGEVTSIIVSDRDVSERREYERALEERERELTRLMENVPGMVFRCRNEPGWPMEFVSEASEEITGYDADALESGAVGFGEDVMVDADRDRVRTEVQEAIDAGEQYSVTYRIETASGDRRWVRAYGRPVYDDESAGAADDESADGIEGESADGTGGEDTLTLQGIVSDVTERKRLEADLRESERRYRALAEYFPNGIVTLFDHDLRYELAAGQGFEKIPVDADDLEGRNVEDVWDEATVDALRPAFEAALDGEEHSVELEYVGREWIVHAVPIADEGGDVFAGMTMAQDITEQKERERELERALDLLNRTERIADVAGWEVDPETGDPYWSDHLFDLLDVEYDDQPTLEEALDVYHTEADREDVESALKEALETGEPFDVEVRFPRPDGDVGWLRIQGDPDVVDGEVVTLRGALQDVTEQKERERYLQEAKDQLEAATEAGSVGTWEWHVDEDRMVTGASFAGTFGVDPEDAREGVSVDQFVESIHEADRDRVEASIEAALENCGEYEEEYRVRDAEGDLRWVVARGHVECDEAGNPVTFPGALTDITERKRAETALERHKGQLETLFELLPVGVVVARPDGELVEANETAREIWGGHVFDADSVAEYDRYDARWADSGEPVDPGEWTMARVLEGEEITEPDVYEIDAEDGERRIVMIHGMPVRDADGEIRRGVVTQTDITERRSYQRRLEETVDKLEASNERLEQFAYAASHDLQEPLRMVSSYLQLIETRYGDQLGEDGEEFLDFAVDGAERMREMIDALLQYSRVETAGDPLEPVELAAVFDAVREDLQLRIEESDAQIEIGSLPRVEGDRSQLRQLFQNLLSNAIEYSGDEPPRIRVSVDRRGSMWEISVSDDGIGIDPDDADRVFEIFQRLHGPEDHAGTGIGLALCRRIVERHGGEIRVDSEPGEGSTFTVTLPAVDDDA